MSGLRVFRMTWNNVLFLAGDEYEAEAVRVEAAAHLSALPETRRRAFTALDYADERLEVLPDESGIHVREDLQKAEEALQAAGFEAYRNGSGVDVRRALEPTPRPCRLAAMSD